MPDLALGFQSWALGATPVRTTGRASFQGARTGVLSPAIWENCPKTDHTAKGKHYVAEIASKVTLESETTEHQGQREPAAVPHRAGPEGTVRKQQAAALTCENISRKDVNGRPLQ